MLIYLWDTVLNKEWRFLENLVVEKILVWRYIKESMIKLNCFNLILCANVKNWRNRAKIVELVK